jgi:ubiquitin carboxyl-terminal hydrolase 34
MDGQPTNVGEQKDAQEFLNVLFDRLENALKPTSRKYLLQSIFGGK